MLEKYWRRSLMLQNALIKLDFSGNLMLESGLPSRIQAEQVVKV